MGYANPMNLGAPEIVLVLIVVLLIFGSSQLPKLAKSLGQAQKEFKSGLKDGAEDDSDDEEETKKSS